MSEIEMAIAHIERMQAHGMEAVDGGMFEQKMLDNIAESIVMMEIALTALRGPVPDPDTGLVLCGCGGKAQIWPSDPTQFTHVITDYEVGCTECAMTTGWVRGKQENAVKVWNTAMGYKGGAE